MDEAAVSGLTWRRSSACASGQCVEVAAAGGWVYFRDGKTLDGAVLRFSRDEFAAFTAGVKGGEFDSI